MHRKLYLYGERTIRRKLNAIAKQYHHYWGDRIGEPRTFEYCFPNGAKLIRLGTHLWQIHGYDSLGKDVAHATEMFEKAQDDDDDESTYAERIISLAYRSVQPYGYKHPVEVRQRVRSHVRNHGADHAGTDHSAGENGTWRLVVG